MQFPYHLTHQISNFFEANFFPIPMQYAYNIKSLRYINNDGKHFFFLTHQYSKLRGYISINTLTSIFHNVYSNLMMLINNNET